MPVNGMNVGVDYSFGYYDGTTQTLVNLGDVQVISIKGMKHDIASKPYNAPPRYGYVPDGFKIDFNITRNTAVMEDLFVTFQNLFDQGAVIQPGYLSETINNSDGSIRRYQYTKFVVFLTDHGHISREKVVTLTLEGMASEKIQIA